MAMTRDQLETYLRHLLGVETDDAFYTTTKLRLVLEQSHRGLVDAIQEVNPEWFQKTATSSESSDETPPSGAAPASRVQASTQRCMRRYRLDRSRSDSPCRGAGFGKHLSADRHLHLTIDLGDWCGSIDPRRTLRHHKSPLDTILRCHLEDSDRSRGV